MSDMQKKPTTGVEILKKGSQLTLDIVDLNNLGCGVGRAPDGRAVFVAGAVVGDRVLAELIKVNKTYAVGRLVKIITSSQYREEGFCSAPLSCGGCVYRHLSYARELELKREYVRQCFRKAGLAEVKVEDVRTTGTVKGYRNKAEYPITMSKNRLCGGFYAQKTHRVVVAEHCSLQPPIFDEILHTVCALLTAQGVSAYNEETGKGLLRHLFLREGKNTGDIMVCPVINGDRLPDEQGFVTALCEAFPGITSILLNINKKSTNVVLGNTYRALWGKDHLDDVLCGVRFAIAPSAFYQVNHDAAELLYGIAKKRAVTDSKNGLLLDLYCGAGTIGLSMADGFSEVIGIEIVPAAIESAKVNAARNGIENAQFYCGDAADTEKLLAAAESARGTLHPDVVILDPPRKGCDRTLLEFLAKREVPRIVYVSCGPDTLARDCAILKDLGYEIGAVTPVDLFPRTGHVESVVCLTRK
ncbi:MAG: 23S rRNA (uracil(1939)-C(5))-methyltransferase RlmD [Ruminococcaceae bacterium]|nr:23S rRNA (uracil(1939)-C(5))-methyltransferase RlmD [Oscillospiraceae bacterium]